VKDAEELFRDGSYDEAELKCNEALKLDPDFFYTYNLLGSIYVFIAILIRILLNYHFFDRDD